MFFPFAKTLARLLCGCGNVLKITTIVGDRDTRSDRARESETRFLFPVTGHGLWGCVVTPAKFEISVRGTWRLELEWPGSCLFPSVPFPEWIAFCGRYSVSTLTPQFSSPQCTCALVVKPFWLKARVALKDAQNIRHGAGVSV